MQSENSLPQGDSSVPRWQQILSERGLLEQVTESLPDLHGIPTVTLSSKVVAIQQGLVSLTETGQVVELRVLGINGKKRTDSGYFNDAEKLAKAAASYDGRAEGIYLR